MCGLHKQNPMPTAESEQTQAESFADYFLHKIASIRDMLKDYAQYCPTGCCQGHLAQFEPVAEVEVRKTIIRLTTKTCELDKLPTKYLKLCLDECIGIITRIMNVSLHEGRTVYQTMENSRSSTTTEKRRILSCFILITDQFQI